MSTSRNGQLEICASLLEHAKLRKVFDHVSRHLATPGALSLSKAAAAAQLSPKHFCELFRDVTGVSFTAWRDSYRIDNAMIMLWLERSRPVSAIGRAVGYEDPTTFGRAFKRFTGLSPRAFRKLTAARKKALISEDALVLYRARVDRNKPGAFSAVAGGPLPRADAFGSRLRGRTE